MNADEFLARLQRQHDAERMAVRTAERAVVVEGMMAAAEARMRARHSQVEGEPWCRACPPGTSWPCEPVMAAL